MSSVLVVDDEQTICDLLTRWLASAGHSVTAVQSAESALEILATTAVDVILCDIDMPVHDGIWLVARVRERFPKVAIVLATGNDAVPPSVSLQSGVSAYVLKPFEKVPLLAIVREAAADADHAGRRNSSIDTWLDQ